ncbi:hypothetical protein HME9304_00179 [Flagellimonas maritima]|uniref:Glutaminyl-tRNA synthetase n=1 Tax=Flagellimonas maritima TaxID=1383885 RepID=A0A2Z4LN05_9FLAO|nr:DUF6327 family protein [Allomuricauda aurantiaca]AWX43192.1 hypothetical protein HME9304_00179 [Allomuricauda aurantiaca]
MNKVDYDSISDIKQELKILRLKKDISLEELKSNKDDFEEAMQPLSLINKFISPFKKIAIAYMLKKIIK